MCVEVMMKAAILQFYKGHESVVVETELRKIYNYRAELHEEMDVFSVPTIVGPVLTPKQIDIQL